MEQTPYKDFTSRFKLLSQQASGPHHNHLEQYLHDTPPREQDPRRPCRKREAKDVREKETIQTVFQDPAFAEFRNINVLPLIYDEKKQRCNILVFDYDRAMSQTARIAREDAGRGRKHAVYRFYDADGDYVCEDRYGDAAANALHNVTSGHTQKTG